MKTKTERRLSAVIMVALLLAWFGVVLMLFYVPRIEALWHRTGMELSIAQTTVVKLTSVVRTNLRAVASLLLLATAVGVTWRIHITRTAGA